LIGIAVTVVFAYACGAVAGYVIRTFGSKEMIYEDEDEFASAD